MPCSGRSRPIVREADRYRGTRVEYSGPLLSLRGETEDQRENIPRVAPRRTEIQEDPHRALLCSMNHRFKSLCAACVGEWNPNGSTIPTDTTVEPPHRSYDRRVAEGRAGCAGRMPRFTEQLPEPACRRAYPDRMRWACYRPDPTASRGGVPTNGTPLFS